MEKQLDLLDFRPALPPVVDPNAHPDDKPRLSASSQAILDRLRDGPASNIDLMQVGGVRYGARIHDLRKYGYTISSDRAADGSWVYQVHE